MLIISPYARPGYDDSTTASFASMLSFTEHNFGLAPLAGADANAYDYSGALDFSQTPLPPVTLTKHPISLWERRWLKAHPLPANET